MPAQVSTYKGHPTLSLHRSENGDRYPFTFGLAKAQLILDNLDAIRRFVAEAQLAPKLRAVETRIRNEDGRHGDPFDMQVEDEYARRAGTNLLAAPD